MSGLLSSLGESSEETSEKRNVDNFDLISRCRTLHFNSVRLNLLLAIKKILMYADFTVRQGPSELVCPHMAWDLELLRVRLGYREEKLLNEALAWVFPTQRLQVSEPIRNLASIHIWYSNHLHVLINPQSVSCVIISDMQPDVSPPWCMMYAMKYSRQNILSEKVFFVLLIRF